jgi:hypothetical protein
MALRYADSCATCGAALSQGTQAYWDATKKTVTCVGCLAPEDAAVTLDRGQAGASAVREWNRRHNKRETRVREQYGRLSGIVLALTDDPHSTAAWAYGARGERVLGAMLDPLRVEGMGVLHDRKIPACRANIDHIVIAPAGVFVVDAKNYKGRVEYVDRGGWFSQDGRLYVGRRDKTSLITGMTKQVEAVRETLRARPSVRIIPVICFVEADWSLFARPRRFGDVHVLWPRELGKLVRAEGTLAASDIAEIECKIALALPAN